MSAACMFEIVMNQGSSFPAASTTVKYFWCDLIAVTRTSAGTARNSGSKPPQTATGHSTRFVTCSSSSSSTTAAPPLARPASSTCRRIDSRRSAGSTMTMAARIFTR